MYRHLLVPTDGSELSNKAIPQAVELAKELGARITALHVSPTFHTFSAEPLVVTDTPEDYAKHTGEVAHEHLEVVGTAARAAGVPCEEVHVFHDEPYRAIIDEAGRRGCDVIVMASHGRRGLGALVLGSETQKVLTHASIPTLVIR